MLTRTWQIFVIWLVLAQPAYALQWGNTGTDYPNTIDTANQRTNKGGGSCSSATTTNICQEWLNDWQAATVAIMTELGTLPKGSYADVKSRLNAAVYSGTSGLSSYTTGDLLYATNTTTLGRLAAVAVGNVLRSGGVGAPPAWGKVDLTLDVTGVLPDANVSNAITLDNITQITTRSHTSLSDIGTNAHSAIDTFIASKAAANGLASLDGSSKVVQDPANATATPGANAIPKAGAGGTIDAGWVPTLNQNTTGTAANLSGTPALPNGVTATTQSQADNSTKVATTAYCDAGLATKLPLTGGTMSGPLGLADQYASSGSNPADTGVYRLSNNEKLCWELATPGTDLCFYIGTDDEFHFDAPVNVGGTGGPFQLTEAAVGDPGTAGKANLGVNTSHMLQWYGNGGSLRTAAYGTTTGVPIGDDTAYGAGWNGSTNTPTQNAVYDKIEALSSTSYYVVTIDSDTAAAPAQNTSYMVTTQGLDNGITARFNRVIPVASTLVAAYWHVSITGTAGTSGQTIAHKICKNASHAGTCGSTTTGVSFDYNGTNPFVKTGNETGLSVSFAAGDTISGLVVTPTTWTTAATNVRVHVTALFTVP